MGGNIFILSCMTLVLWLFTKPNTIFPDILVGINCLHGMGILLIGWDGITDNNAMDEGKIHHILRSHFE